MAKAISFWGVTVPESRKIAMQFLDLPLKSLQGLLNSKIHEERLVGLLILMLRFKKSSGTERATIYRFYVRHMKQINNWDLVDLSAPNIVGAFLKERSRSPLYEWVRSKNLWYRRIAIISTLQFIRNNDFQDTLRLSENLLNDPADLIHKAVGWMLREVGKQNLKSEERFLKRHYQRMPRTMLRYAIERFPETRRLAYLKGTV